MLQINWINIFLLLFSVIIINGTKPLYFKYKDYIYGGIKKSMVQIHVIFFILIYGFISVLFSVNYETFLEPNLSFDEPKGIWYTVLSNASTGIYNLEQASSLPEYFEMQGWRTNKPIEPVKPVKPERGAKEFELDYEARLATYEEAVKTYETNLEQYKKDKKEYDEYWDNFMETEELNTPQKVYNDIISHEELLGEDGYKYLKDVDSFEMLLSSSIWDDNSIKISKNLSNDVFVSDFIINLRLNQSTAFLLPNFIALMIPALFFTIILVRLVYLPLKTPKIYINELRNINRFTAFLNYNVKFNNNEKVLLNESLRGIEQDYFFETAGKILTSETVNSKEKYEELLHVFNFQFLSLYFSLFQVMLNEGVTPEGLSSLELAQFQGEKYYKSIDRLYQAKKSALSSVRMVILVIGGAVPILTKKNVTDLYLCYLYSDGYMATIIFYSVILGIFVAAVLTYSDNKIIKKEGRYI